jgi:hypothetical protein
MTLRPSIARPHAELTSQSPQSVVRAREFISDTHKIASKDTQDFIGRSIELGFVDYEGEDGDGLLFNGNLFKRKADRRLLQSTALLGRVTGIRPPSPFVPEGFLTESADQNRNQRHTQTIGLRLITNMVRCE